MVDQPRRGRKSQETVLFKLKLPLIGFGVITLVPLAICVCVVFFPPEPTEEKDKLFEVCLRVFSMGSSAVVGLLIGGSAK